MLLRSLTKIGLAVLGIVAALSLWPPQASAFKLIGAGTDACATWTADRRTPDGKAALQDAQWVVGYLSGIGYEGPSDVDPLNGVDAEAVWTWIDNYCRAHPMDEIRAAAEAFFHAHPR